MKKLLFLCIFMAINIQAQTTDFICALPDSTTPDSVGAFSYSTDLNHLETFEPVVFNVFFWGINEDDGASTKKLTQTMALKVIADLNIKFNDANIFFKYYGYDRINSSDFYTIYLSCNDVNADCYGSTLYEDFPFFLNDNPQYVTENAINFYIPRNTVGFAGFGSSGSLRTVVNAASFENGGRVVNHEMGHILGLLHTDSGWIPPNGNDSCEHVTREKFLPNGDLNPDYNADEAGDWVTDTAAVPDFRNERCVELGYEYPYTDCPDNLKYYYLDEETCTYFGSGDDCLEPLVPYDITEEDVRNLMAYTLGTCGLDLTTGQHIRMRDRIANSIVHYQTVMNDVSSLYEPYEGVYINSFTDSKPRFQPGFDYQYLSCYPEGGYQQPSDYYDTSFNYVNGGLWWYGFSKNIAPQYYNTIFHKNGFAIRIEQLELQPRKCWNNGIAQGGTIIKFNDNVFNNNVTITEQDSTTINNEEFVNDLQQGLYNVIKEYNDGRTEETVIFKENN